MEATGEHTYGEDNLCTGCGAEKPVEHVHDYEKVVTDPTCTEAGYTTYTCECGHSYVDDNVDALGHDYKSEVTDPTCTEAGYTTHTCGTCGDTYTDTPTDALGHTSEYADNGDGTHNYTCGVCGTVEKTEAHIYDNEADTTCNACGAVRVVGPVYDDTLRFNGISLSLNSSLAINWYFASNLVTGATDYYVVFEKTEGNGQEGTLTATVQKAQMLPVYSGSTLTRYEVAFDKVAACEMGESIKAKLYIEKDGVWYVSKEFTYSVKQYAEKTINDNKNLNTDKAFKEMQLMIECLNYGAAAQTRFGYKTDALVNANITAEQQSKYGIGEITYKNCVVTEGDNKTSPVLFKGVGLYLENRINMAMSLAITGKDVNSLTAVVWNTAGEIVQVATGDTFTPNNGKYEVGVSVIDAPNLRDLYSIQIFEGYVDESNMGTAVSALAYFNVESYVYFAQGEDLAVALAALKYGDAAAKYFAN